MVAAPVAVKEPRPGEKILIWILQIVGFLTALIFGTFSVLSWKIAQQATAEASSANLLSFIALCEQALTDNSLIRSSRHMLGCLEPSSSIIELICRIDLPNISGNWASNS
ncbi:hypothetical protein BU16DRAFT_556910 [Lophium mytilinum]|uniref:Uncharacterized protein n=1 Tax=Lophium mytilinum TaxID=390894 RepID=A0A6A6R7T6_9PEZI|nr:hypothetical protein BU16DRAFT_556910 [Lophium mytilinum]